MGKHNVYLTNDEKTKWFKARIAERLKVKNIESEQELIDLVRGLRRSFKELYQRDVPGSFIRILLKELGIARKHSEAMQKKREYMFSLMNNNTNFRDNKTQCRKAVEAEFAEKILGIVFDEIWDEWHGQDDLPDAKTDIDIYGQKSLF